MTVYVAGDSALGSLEVQVKTHPVRSAQVTVLLAM